MCTVHPLRPLNKARSSPQPSLSFALKRAQGNGGYRQNNGRKQRLRLLGLPRWQLPVRWHLADGNLTEMSSRFCSTGREGGSPMGTPSIPHAPPTTSLRQNPYYHTRARASRVGCRLQDGPAVSFTLCCVSQMKELRL